MTPPPHVLYLVDAAGTPQAVQLSPQLWRIVEPEVCKALTLLEGPVAPAPEPLQAFEEFLQYWDFRYAYSPEVTCPHCGAHTSDWRTDEAHGFRLCNANVGGLLVFHCTACGTSIRQKHFRDHRAVEHSVPKG